MNANNCKIKETEYKMANEAKYGTLFTTSNGYMGVRASFEENATVEVQGAFIRGLIDEIPFFQALSIENEYMRKYYVNEDAAKDAEFQESVINFADFLLIKVEIDGETFYPWEGKILKWERTLDIENNELIRNVLWENSKGDKTQLEFKRFASFADDHIYAMSVKITPKNHSKDIKIISGADLRTKSGGFKMCELKQREFKDNTICFTLKTLGKYAHEVNIGIVNGFETEKNFDNGKFLLQEKTFNGEKNKTIAFEKKIFVNASIDRDNLDVKSRISKLKNENYNTLFKAHKKSWSEFFDKINIDIEGDDEADRALKFCSYHTAVSIPKNDFVHSLAAKNLTGEGYSDYVWWDCEVYQCPIFIYVGIENVKNMLMYRYERLDAAREIARQEGRRGARYPFISSVTGEEKVWRHVRHPFMQFHVAADVAWGVLNYYYATGDDEFMKDYGLKMLCEITEYWAARAELKNGRYEICEVTGCDEHHPYVDNDAYTNYLVKYVTENTIKLCKRFNIAAKKEWKSVAENIYLPMEKSGLIPQFDGYFELSKELETVGGGGGGFQMKNAGGMYHKSQVIKQPDVMVLFSYIHNDFEKSVYERNWDYYETMCEASSSLTFPVHSICAFDNNQLLKGYNYFLKSALIDLNDIHGVAKTGVHAGCTAGAWYSIVRGLAGIEMYEDYVKINPKMLPWWKSVSFKLSWHGKSFSVRLSNDGCEISTKKAIPFMIKNEIREALGAVNFEL